MKDWRRMASAAFGAAFLTVFGAAPIWAGNVYETTRTAFEGGAVRLAESGETIYFADFGADSASKFETNNFEGQTAIEFGREKDGRARFYVSNSNEEESDTAWTLTTELIPLDGTRRVALRYLSSASQTIRSSGESSWYSRFFWFDASGEPCDLRVETLFPFAAGGTVPSEQTFAVDVPEGAASCRIRFGFDIPNVKPGEWVALDNLTLERIDAQKPFGRSGSFVSEIFANGGPISWGAETPVGTAVKFQAATADADADGNPGEFSPFAGPDGSDSFYEEPFEVRAPFVQYKATLVPNANGGSAPTLRSVSVGDQVDQNWNGIGDSTPPRVSVSPNRPTSDARAAIEVAVADDSPIRFNALRIELDGIDATEKFVREKNRLTLTPDADWTPGVRSLVVAAEDVRGNAVVARKYFYVGDAPTTTPNATLRGDGAVLVDGEPFFPIGIYGVTKREFNGDNIDEAFRGLKEAGFNFAHSYGMPRTDEFLAAAEKYEFKLWSVAREPDERFVEIERNSPAILAWYLGDDTSDNTTPEELRDRRDAVRAVDGTRLTTQADPVFVGESAPSRYFPYVDGTDCFMPEIYPVRGDGPDSGKECVAQTIRDMERALADVAEVGDGPKSIWPIIQYFQGWGWKRFPTFDELYGMSFASLIHGANGITWYTYGGFVEPELGKFNYGVTTTPERWANISTVATRINELSPILLEQEKLAPPKIDVLDGPTTDPLGQPSISTLTKRHNGETYCFAVNSAPEPVSVRIAFAESFERGDVLYADRALSFDEDRGTTERFEPFGVRIYRLK